VAKRVFISYRRDDTGPAAGRIYDRLWRLVSKANVFFDVSTIGGGEDFAGKIVAEIARSDAVLVFIGQRWLEPGHGGAEPRLFADGDYVRAELKAALARGVLVVPVLVDGAPMPRAEALPADVREVATRNALPLRHATFDDDAETIVATALGLAGKERSWEQRSRIGITVAYGIGGGVLALVALAAVALGHFWLLSRPLSVSIGSTATTVLLIAAPVLGAWLGLRRAARRGSN
jgi:hypothetical protein